MQFNQLTCREKKLDLEVPQVMGILNITPDSFYDGGRYMQRDEALYKAENLIEDGAVILDIGGESSRPGAVPISISEEIDRVVPVIEYIKQNFSIIISVDTCKVEVMRAAYSAGADMINDIKALQTPGALEFLSQNQAGICLMHMQGEPATMQKFPCYKNVAKEVYEFLAKRLQACQESGIQMNRIVIDPGFGFGKTITHNFQLLSKLSDLKKLGVSILVGLSRKAMIGKLLGLTPEHRLSSSLALAVIAVMQGASIVRTHDVRETKEAITIASAFLTASKDFPMSYED